jgi:heme exporter protein CcmD
MTEWLLERGHWAFVILAYLVTLILVLADVLAPWLRERRLTREIRALARRSDARSKTR